MKKANPKISAANKPTVTISLKPHLADFCRHEFSCSKEDYIILNRRHIIGKQINGLYYTAEFPQRRPLKSNQVTFVLPVTEKNHYILQSRFYYVPRWCEEKIQDFIESEMRDRFRIYFEKGYLKKYTQKQIIEAILQEYNIKHTAQNFEAIKKMDYRNQRKIREMIFKDLENASA